MGKPVKIIKIEKCTDCPNCHSDKIQVLCTVENRDLFNSVYRDERIPDWCPLEDR